MSKERLEEITQMVNSFDDSSFSATLYGYEMGSKALISDFVYLLKHIDEQQAELETLSMAHDAIHRELPKDKHTLIKSNINKEREIAGLRERVQELERQQKKNDDYTWKLLMDIKRYREALEYIADNKIEHGWHLKAVNCVVRARRALEGEE